MVWTWITALGRWCDLRARQAQRREAERHLVEFEEFLDALGRGDEETVQAQIAAWRRRGAVDSPAVGSVPAPTTTATPRRPGRPKAATPSTARKKGKKLSGGMVLLALLTPESLAGCCADGHQPPRSVIAVPERDVPHWLDAGDPAPFGGWLVSRELLQIWAPSIRRQELSGAGGPPPSLWDDPDWRERLDAPEPVWEPHEPADVFGGSVDDFPRAVRPRPLGGNQ